MCLRVLKIECLVVIKRVAKQEAAMFDIHQNSTSRLDSRYKGGV